jgi:hypothetical protein
MARGWESKAIEQQQEDARSLPSERRQPLSPEQKAEQLRREALQLSRRRMVQQLEAATNPQHRKMLEAALADLDARLGEAARRS